MKDRKHTIVKKHFAPDGLVGCCCKLLLDNGETVTGYGIYGETLNHKFNVGDRIEVRGRIESHLPC